MWGVTSTADRRPDPYKSVMGQSIVTTESTLPGASTFWWKGL